MTVRLPHNSERGLLERFLRAEAMAWWSIRSAQTQDVPLHDLTFLRQHEEDEQEQLDMGNEGRNY